MPAHRLLRRTAALLAWVGLLAMPARGILACPMPTDVVTLEQQPSEHVEHGEHAEHADDAPNPVHHVPGSPDAPCVDLAHCAVAAVPMASNAVADEVPLVLRVTSPPRTAHSAPARAVEPPPPRA